MLPCAAIKTADILMSVFAFCVSSTINRAKRGMSFIPIF